MCGCNSSGQSAFSLSTHTHSPWLNHASIHRKSERRIAFYTTTTPARYVSPPPLSFRKGRKLRAQCKLFACHDCGFRHLVASLLYSIGRIACLGRRGGLFLKRVIWAFRLRVSHFVQQLLKKRRSILQIKSVCARGFHCVS